MKILSFLKVLFLIEWYIAARYFRKKIHIEAFTVNFFFLKSENLLLLKETSKMQSYQRTCSPKRTYQSDASEI